jgi:hypothetical protein
MGGAGRGRDGWSRRVKTLLDGRRVTNDSAEWRLECLARHVLDLRTLAERRAWLADFEKRSGERRARDRSRAEHAALLAHCAKRHRRERRVLLAIQALVWAAIAVALAFGFWHRP